MFFFIFCQIFESKVDGYGLKLIKKVKIIVIGYDFKFNIKTIVETVVIKKDFYFLSKFKTCHQLLKKVRTLF